MSVIPIEKAEIIKPILRQKRINTMALLISKDNETSLKNSANNIVITGLQPAGLSHSEILGSKVICTYPRLIAAYHVLHRLREPRHPPYALIYFPGITPKYIHTSK